MLSIDKLAAPLPLPSVFAIADGDGVRYNWREGWWRRG